jgi:hypothetical protein
MEDIRKGVCPLCKHNKIIRQVEPDDPEETSHGACSLAPFCVAHEHKRFGGMIGYGTFNAHVCQRCGYAQWFAENPSDVPIGEKHFTDLVTGPEPEGPYR